MIDSTRAVTVLFYPVVVERASSADESRGYRSVPRADKLRTREEEVKKVWSGH